MDDGWEHIAAGTLVAIFALLFAVPWLWFQPENRSAPRWQRRLNIAWNFFGAFLIGSVVLLGGVITTAWFITAGEYEPIRFIFGCLCVSPSIFVSAILAWLILWPKRQSDSHSIGKSTIPRQMTIKQLLVGTLLLAIVMAAVRLAFEYPEISGFIVVIGGLIITLPMIAGYLIFNFCMDEPIIPERPRSTPLPEADHPDMSERSNKQS